MSNYLKISLAVLRVTIGWLFFYAGWDKVITFFTDAKDWSAAGYLSHLTGPFASMFSALAGNPVVDYLNAYGLLLVGLATIFGVLTRWSAFWGIVIMVFYYLSAYPAEHSFVVEDHFVYAVVFVVIAASGAGRYFGLDKVIEESQFVGKNKWLLKLLG